jgi:hypothetical protein
MATNLRKLKTVKKDFGRVEDGTYPARIVQLIMLGSQLQTDWQTGEAKEDKDGNLVYKDEIWITYEFPTERVKYTNDEGEEVDRPRWQSKTYTLSMHEKAAFRHLMDALAPTGESLDDLIGQGGIVTIGSTSGGKAKVTAVAAPMKGMDIPALENEAVIYDLEDPDLDVFDSLPEFLKEKIRNRHDKPGAGEDEPEAQADPFAA